MILRLKQTPGIFLVGFMASGKTTIGRGLAERLGWSFADLDQDIEAKQNMPIAEIFEKLGEPAFREMEHAALDERAGVIRRGSPTVVALGGGTFVTPDNLELIRRSGVSIWLDAPFELVARRVAQAAHRPLARDPQRFRDLFEARRAAYSQADHRVEITGDDPAAAINAILELPTFQ